MYRLHRCWEKTLWVWTRAEGWEEKELKISEDYQYQGRQRKRTSEGVSRNRTGTQEKNGRCTVNRKYQTAAIINIWKTSWIAEKNGRKSAIPRKIISRNELKIERVVREIWRPAKIEREKVK